MSIEPFHEISILSSTDELLPTKRYFIQRLSQEKTKDVPQEFKDLAVDRMIYHVERKEITAMDFDNLVTSAQTQ